MSRTKNDLYAVFGNYSAPVAQLHIGKTGLFAARKLEQLFRVEESPGLN